MSCLGHVHVHTDWGRIVWRFCVALSLYIRFRRRHWVITDRIRIGIYSSLSGISNHIMCYVVSLFLKSGNQRNVSISFWNVESTSSSASPKNIIDLADSTKLGPCDRGNAWPHPLWIVGERYAPFDTAKGAAGKEIHYSDCAGSPLVVDFAVLCARALEFGECWEIRAHNLCGTDDLGVVYYQKSYCWSQWLREEDPSHICVAYASKTSWHKTTIIPSKQHFSNILMTWCIM